MSVDQYCILCKIIAGDIPSAKVYEDEDVYAFLDISQVTTGHTLVIPKAHVKNIYDTNEEVASQLFARVHKISQAIEKSFSPKGINVLSNSGETAGHPVFLLTVTLIPRY